MPVYGQDFRYSGQWLTAEKDRIEYRLGKTARTIAPEHSPPTPRSRPNSASSLPSSPNVNLTGLKPLTPRSGPLALTPTSTTMALPSSHNSSGQEFYGGVARQPPMGQGYGAPGVPFGISESPSRDNRGETDGPGPIRRRRTSSNASVSNKGSSLGLSSNLQSGTMSPPVALKPMRPISREGVQGSESPRWFVELSETATWCVRSLNHKYARADHDRLPSFSTQDDRRCGDKGLHLLGQSRSQDRVAPNTSSACRAVRSARAECRYGQASRVDDAFHVDIAASNHVSRFWTLRLESICKGAYLCFPIQLRRWIYEGRRRQSQIYRLVGYRTRRGERVQVHRGHVGFHPEGCPDAITSQQQALGCLGAAGGYGSRPYCVDMDKMRKIVVLGSQGVVSYPDRDRQ